MKERTKKTDWHFSEATFSKELIREINLYWTLLMPCPVPLYQTGDPSPRCRGCWLPPRPGHTWKVPCSPGSGCTANNILKQGLEERPSCLKVRQPRVLFMRQSSLWDLAAVTLQLPSDLRLVSYSSQTALLTPSRAVCEETLSQ